MHHHCTDTDTSTYLDALSDTDTCILQTRDGAVEALRLSLKTVHGSLTNIHMHRYRGEARIQETLRSSKIHIWTRFLEGDGTEGHAFFVGGGRGGGGAVFNGTSPRVNLFTFTKSSRLHQTLLTWAGSLTQPILSIKRHLVVHNIILYLGSTRWHHIHISTYCT